MNHASNEQVTVRSALILYGTETGNAQDAAEEAGRTVERLHFSVRVAELDEASLVSGRSKPSMLCHLKRSNVLIRLS